METKINTNDDIILYALRYSLTRQTNAPIKVMDAIIQNIDYITIENIMKIIEEIESSTDVGFTLYEETWTGLVKDLKFELKIRKLRV